MKTSITKLNYEDAKRLIQANNIKTAKKYKEFKKMISGLPKNPGSFYKKEWKGSDDFFGTEVKLNYEDAKKLVQVNNIKTRKEYTEFQKTLS